MYLFRTFLLKALLLFLVLPLPTWGGAVITYHGRILDVQKQPVESNLVNFRVRVYSPNPSKCLLYEEVRSVDMSNSQGVFVIPIGDGLGTRTAADPGLTIEKIFNNDPTYTFDTTNTPKLVCNSGVSFTADPLDQRLLAVSFDDNSGLGEQTLPLMDINFVPLAVNAYDAQNIGGAPANSVLRVQGGTASPLTPAYFSELINLITGVSTQYERVGRLNGQAVPALANGQVLGWNGGWTAVTPLTSFTESDPSVKTFAKTDLPACTGSSFYQNDGSGNLACASGNYITTMTGDVTSSGFTAGSVSTTIANNAINSAKISDGAILGTDMSFAGVNTATSNLVIKDSTGKFFDFSCGTAGHVATWTVAGWACQNPGSGVSGSGTVDTVPLFSAASTLADSPIVVSSGNVGIGTTPYGILHAGKDQNAMTIFYLSNYDAGASAGSKVVIEGDMNSFTLQKNSFAQANSGHSKSDGAIVHTGGAGGISITASNPSGGIRFYTAGTSDASERMVISSSGNVGIGIEAPTEKLDVVGNIKTSGCIYYASSSLGTCASDERIKTDVQPFDLGLDALLGINPVQFKYNGLAGFKADGKEQLGVIAQDVEKVAPKLVKTEMVMLSPKDQEKTQIKVVDYGAFTYVIINAVKELYAKVVSLEGSQSTLKTDSELLDKKIKQLELDIQTRDQRIKDLEDRLIRVEQALTSK